MNNTDTVLLSGSAPAAASESASFAGESVTFFLTGDAVLAALRKGVPGDEIARRLARVHKLGYGRALRDVLEFRMHLVRLNKAV